MTSPAPGASSSFYPERDELSRVSPRSETDNTRSLTSRELGREHCCGGNFAARKEADRGRLRAAPSHSRSASCALRGVLPKRRPEGASLILRCVGESELRPSPNVILRRASRCGD